MTEEAPFKISTGDRFEMFANAPIVEAVIDIRATAVKTLLEAETRSFIEKELPGYVFLDSQRAFEHQVKIEQNKPPAPTFHDLGWKGIRFQSRDAKHIAQFNLNGFVFSRLAKYENWSQLTAEGLGLWQAFRKLADPAEIKRIGLRFINRIPLPSTDKVSDYIQKAPVSPEGLDVPLKGFIHKDMFEVPHHPYTINVIQTIQPPNPPGHPDQGIILDIDVFTTRGFTIEGANLDVRLEEMRWLKNKAFNGLITDKARKSFQ